MRHPPIMTICSQSACCGHARLCICKHFSTQVHRWGVWACDHICKVLYRIFPARLQYRVNTRSILCACNFCEACWKMGHRSITASLCWSAGRQHVLPRDLTEPDNQTNPIHSVSFWHLCLCSDLLFSVFFYLLLYLTGYIKDWKPTLPIIGITVQTSTVKVRKKYSKWTHRLITFRKANCSQEFAMFNSNQWQDWRQKSELFRHRHILTFLVTVSICLWNPCPLKTKELLFGSKLKETKNLVRSVTFNTAQMWAAFSCKTVHVSSVCL